MSTRRMRAFKRWMAARSIETSPALRLVEATQGDGISVEALRDLHEGDVVATIPKQCCLTLKTSGASEAIREHGLGGYLGLSVAIMYELSLGPNSMWFEYLQVFPEGGECIPLLWEVWEVDGLLRGTELHQTVKEDKILAYEDWRECVVPFVDSAPIEINPDFFSFEQYLAAKSLIASRSFEIDEDYGFGMVPLADLFNHKTGAEDVHFTSLTFDPEEDNDASENMKNLGDNSRDAGPVFQNVSALEGYSSDSDVGSSVVMDNPAVLEMIIVKEVKAGSEVFNTYGSLGNAALLHRYGFTEPDNPYDIVNIDLELVHQWSSSLFSPRHSRSRLSLWRKLDISQDLEYFEISIDGEPQVELLILLYLILLPEAAYNELYLKVSTSKNSGKWIRACSSKKETIMLGDVSEVSKSSLLTESVCSALLSLADIREQNYGSSSLEDDVRAWKVCSESDRKLYHSLMLRISERRILEKLRSYASSSGKPNEKRHS